MSHNVMEERLVMASNNVRAVKLVER